MMRRILLVRHPPVAREFTGICYGSSDVPLGSDGMQEAMTLAGLLAAEPITRLYHSGLARCATVAELISRRTGIPPIADARLQERCFGSWELRSWEDIYTETGKAMLGMVSAPATWCPPGGETTFAVRDRVVEWYRDLPAGELIVAVIHGGPISVLRGTLNGMPVSDWLTLIPSPGTIVEVE